MTQHKCPVSGSIITLNMTEELSTGAAYYINIGAGVIKDQAGNSFAGISDSTSYNFSTLAVADDHPWSTSTTAVMTIDGAASTGRIEIALDADLFKISLSAGETYTIDATSSNDDGLANPYLYLYSPDIDLLKSDDDSGGGSNAQLNYTATSSGTYYVGVRDYGTGVGNYQLQASRVVDDYPWATSTSGVVNVNGELASGRIEVSEDYDLFKINLTEGTTYTIDATSSNNNGLANPYLYLFSPDIELLNSDDDSGEGYNAQLTYTATTSGTYYVGVSDAGSGIGAYTVNVANFVDVSGPTLLSVSPADNATNVVNGAVFEFNFNETIQRGTGNLLIHNSDGSLSQTISVNDTAQVSVFGSIMTLDLTDELSPGAGYYINIDSGVVKDQAGNSFTGISDSTSYNFTTSGDDDYPWSTSTTGAVTIDGTASTGRIEIPSDADLFKISLSAGETYMIDASSSNNDGLTDPYLYLYSPDVELLESDDDSGGGSNARITYTAATSGTYYVGVADYGTGVGNYQLQASKVVDDYPWSTATSGVVNVNGTLASGRIEISEDKDLFQISLLAGETYTIDATASDTDGLANPYLYLYSPDVELLVSDDDSGAGSNAQLSYTATSSGIYYVGVSDYATGVGNYQLQASRVVDDYPWATSTSGVVNVDGGLASGRVEISADADLFKISLLAGETYTIDATASDTDGLANPYLYLYSPDVELLVSDDDSGAGSNAQLSYTATSSGTYYVGVSDQGTGVGNYQLQASRVVDDYPWATSTSGVVNVNGVLARGRIEVSEDKDLFTISLVEGETYSIEAKSSDDNGLTDPYLYLYSSVIELLKSDDDNGGGSTAQLTYTATTTGIYYVGVSDFGSGVGNYTVKAIVDDYPWSTSTSGVVNVDGTRASGRIEVSEDADLFQISLLAGETYTIDATASDTDGLANPYLYLYSPDIELLVSDDDSGAGSNAQLTYTATTSGTYYLGVSDYGTGVGNYQLTTDTVSITGSVVVGSDENDVLTGTTGDDTLRGFAGQDTLDGLAGNDVLEGGLDIDLAVFHGNRSNFSVINSSGELEVTGPMNSGNDLLINIERLQFDDVSIAFDLDGNAGTIAKLFGIVLGKDNWDNKEFIGIGLGIVDNTVISFEALMDLAFEAVLGPSPTNKAVVNLIYNSLSGQSPSEGELNALTADLLDSGAFTQGSLGVLAAEHELNTTNIGLVGLADTGLEYLPFG